MKRYLAMLGMAAMLVLPVTAGAEVNDDAHIAVQRTADAEQLAMKKGVITEKDLTEMSALATSAPAKTDQESNSFPNRYELNW